MTWQFNPLGNPSYPSTLVPYSPLLSCYFTVLLLYYYHYYCYCLCYQCRFTALLLYCFTVVLLFCCFAVLLFCCFAVLLFCCHHNAAIATLLRYPSCYATTVAALLSCYLFGLLPYYITTLVTMTTILSSWCCCYYYYCCHYAITANTYCYYC